MNYTDKELAVIAADGISELNYTQKKLLLASCNEEAADREKYGAELIKILGGGVYNKIRDKFLDGKFRSKLIEAYEKRGISCVTVKSGGYPQQLKHTPAPPLVLYCRGNTHLLGSRMLGVVGSRKTTAQVTAECKAMCAELSAYVTVVTGIADGADSAAATGALQTGNVICVLPCGHGVSSSQTLKAVEAEGLSVSEFPPGVKIQRHTFTLRNRVIAGMSEGVLVVSAGEKSGALSTAGYAADYSRDVFAFPYGLGVSSGVGCNALIKNGAYLVDCAEDVLNVFGIECGAREEEQLDGDERTVVALLKREGELHAQQIAQLLNVKLTDAVTLCSMLEIKGVIVRTGSNSFAAL